MSCLHANCPFIDLKTMVGIFFPFCSQDGHRWPKAMQVCVCVLCECVSPESPTLYWCMWKTCSRSR